MTSPYAVTGAMILRSPTVMREGTAPRLGATDRLTALDLHSSRPSPAGPRTSN